MSGFHPARLAIRLVWPKILLFTLLALAAPAWAGRTIAHVELIADSPSQASIAFAPADGKALDINCFTLADPLRLVFDLPGVQLDPEIPKEFSLTFPGVARLRIGQFSADPLCARAVLDLTAQPEDLTWEIITGERGETFIVLRKKGAAFLPRPTIEKKQDMLFVRLAKSSTLHYSTGLLDNPLRLFIDLENALIEEHFEEDSSEAPLRQLRMGQQGPIDGRPVARLVLEFTERKPFAIVPDHDDLLIVVGDQAWAFPLSEYQPFGRLAGRTIVVDPGHGGTDPGAPAIFGPPSQEPYEKDIVLDIGLRLRSILQAEGAKVAMTREDDTYIPLRDRAALANKLKADAFISIHCNSCDRPNTLHGTSVYFDHSHSENFARLVQSEMVAALGTADRGIRNANFAVIRRTTGPGILVETAFINHEGDRARLVNANFRERTARAIVRGLIRFLDSQ